MQTRKHKPDQKTPSARKKAMDLLLRMDRTERNLREKLREKEFSEEEIEDAVSYVKGFHYLDDERYVENYIRFHENEKSRGRLRIDLLRRGADPELIDRFLEGYGGNEEAMIREILRKKQYQPDMEEKEKRRIYAFLQRRGFGTEKILSAMRGDSGAF